KFVIVYCINWGPLLNTVNRRRSDRKNVSGYPLLRSKNHQQRHLASNSGRSTGCPSPGIVGDHEATLPHKGEAKNVLGRLQ
ncbi:MAG: hypothetical protein WA902_18345, partial [Thermosynechococcaceae cyanobacterium]